MVGSVAIPNNVLSCEEGSDVDLTKRNGGLAAQQIPFHCMYEVDPYFEVLPMCAYKRCGDDFFQLTFDSFI
ncbi:hypothetical protein Tco_1409352, partial [Tanacetum coccineum]